MVEKAASFTLKRLKQLQWNKMFNMMYVEPIIFLLVFAHSLSGTILRSQMIYQACTTVFNYSESDCRQLGTKNVSDYINEIETEVQPYVANLFMIRTLLESIVPAICGIFIGSWSDHYGRKPLLLVSMIGFSFTYLIAAAICQISEYYPLNPWWYILAAVPHSFLGGNCVFSVAAFCFLSDVTDTKTRPYRMILWEAFFFVGLTTGSLLSSFVYAATNATITFIISGVLMCGATIFIVGWVPESLNFKKEENEKTDEVQVTCTDIRCVDEMILAPDTDDENTSEEKKPKDVEKNMQTAKTENELNKENAEKNGIQSKNAKETENAKEKDKVHLENAVKDEKVEKADKTEKGMDDQEQKRAGLFSYTHIKDMLDCCFKKRDHYDRCIIWLVTGTMFLSIFVFDGAMTVFYLFVREKFHWTIRDFTFYETVSHVVTMFGAIVGFLILRKVFKLSIVSLAILAFLSDTISSIVRGVAADAWHLYLAVALGAFKSIGGPMCRTIVSNIVPPTDLGKIFSIKNILQSIAPFLASPLYTLIYNKSLTTFPGFFNIISAVLYFIAFVFMVIVLRFKFSNKEHYAKILK